MTSLEVPIQERQAYLVFAEKLATHARDILTEPQVRDSAVEAQQKADGPVTRFDILVEERWHLRIAPTEGCG